MQARVVCIPLVLLIAVAEAAAQEETGFYTEVGANRAVLFTTEYTGFCAGRETSRMDARFASRTTPPAPGLRVRVTNVSWGMDRDPYPYTDRDYDEGDLSDRTILDLDDEHHTRTLSVRPGVNQFEYRIYRERGDQTVESGRFDLDVEVVQRGPIERLPYCEWRQDCSVIGPCRWYHDCRCP